MTTTSNVYTIDTSIVFGDGFVVWNKTTASYLKDSQGEVRLFKTRSSARKAVTRLRRRDAGVPQALHL